MNTSARARMRCSSAASLGVLDVGDQALLAAVQPDEIAGQPVRRGIVAAREIALRPLDLDHPRAGIGKAGTAIGRGDRLLQRDHQEPVQRVHLSGRASVSDEQEDMITLVQMAMLLIPIHPNPDPPDQKQGLANPAGLGPSGISPLGARLASQPCRLATSGQPEASSSAPGRVPADQGDAVRRRLAVMPLGIAAASGDGARIKRRQFRRADQMHHRAGRRPAPRELRGRSGCRTGRRPTRRRRAFRQAPAPARRTRGAAGRPVRRSALRPASNAAGSGAPSRIMRARIVWPPSAA